MKYYCNSVAKLLTIMLLMIVAGCASNTMQEVKDYEAAGDAYRADFEYDKALTNYLKAAELNPETADIYYKIGLVYGLKHSREHPYDSVVAGRQNQLSRIERAEDSNYYLAVKYFRKASDLGHRGARNLLRTMDDNLQHFDVSY